MIEYGGGIEFSNSFTLSSNEGILQWDPVLEPNKVMSGKKGNGTYVIVNNSTIVNIDNVPAGTAKNTIIFFNEDIKKWEICSASDSQQVYRGTFATPVILESTYPAANENIGSTADVLSTGTKWFVNTSYVWVDSGSSDDLSSLKIANFLSEFNTATAKSTAAENINVYQKDAVNTLLDFKIPKINSPVANQIPLMDANGNLFKSNKVISDFEPTITKNNAFNQNFETSTVNIKMDGIASVGSLNNIPRSDHTHPSDTTKANIDSPSFTGTPTVPTAPVGTNTTQIASTAFVKTEIPTVINSLDVLVFKGIIDASTNPNYPAGDAGHIYRVNVAGKIGGPSGINVAEGNLLLCLIDNSPAGNQATVGSNWNISQANIDGAVTTNETTTTDNDFVVFSGTSGKVIKKTTQSVFKTLLNLSKADVGLSNIDNTSDLNKPISTATQNALNGKQDIITLGSSVASKINDTTTIAKTLTGEVITLDVKDNSISTTKLVDSSVTNVKVASNANIETSKIKQSIVSPYNDAIINNDSQETINNKAQGQINHLAGLLNSKEVLSNKVSAFSLTPNDTNYPTEKLVKDNLNTKVDKVIGKQLSTEDYTTTEKNKLAGIASGAEVNVQADWTQSDNLQDDFIKNKPTLGTVVSKDVGTAIGNIQENGAVLGNSAIVETDATGKFITTSKNTAYNKHFGTLNGEVARGDASYLKADTYTKTEADNLLNLKQNTSEKGHVNGYASLDGAGKVPASQLPSFVDDVVEYADVASFPTTGETGKVYVALDTNLTYRWSGSVYVKLNDVDLTNYFNKVSDTTDNITEGTKKFTTQADIDKLAGIEPNATADQTASEIKTLYESNSDTNAFTDAEKTKLSQQSGTNTGDETTLSIQTKRPLKTVKGQSLEGSGNIDLTKSDVGLANVDNTSDADKPVSTAQQTALDAKLAKASNLTDVSNRQTALDNLTNVASATNEYVLTKDTATGNAIFKLAAGGGSPLTTKGDIYVAGTGGVATRLPVGTDNQILIADSTQATGLRWGAAPEPSSVRLLASSLSSPSQSLLQAYYDNQSGNDAPDTVPVEVTSANVGISGYSVYLGHNIWYYTDSNNGWLAFGGSKGPFGALVQRLYTFK